MEKRADSIIWPDYDRSILGIPNALLRHYGAETKHPSLPLLDAALARGYRNVALLVFDGLGSDALRRNLPADAFLRRHTAGDILSVYPCTTTAAVTCYETGLPPIAHGWLGWSCYFKEIGQCVDLFTNQVRKDTSAGAQNMAWTYMPYTSISERIAAASPDTDVRRVSFLSQTNTAVTPAEICTQVRTICQAPGRHFVNAYCNQPDHDMHEQGCYAAHVKQLFRHINDEAERLCRVLTDTLVIITADHGLTDTRDVMIEEYPSIYECLQMRPSVESRCLSLFIKEGMADIFAERFNAQFGDDFILLTREEALARGIFGRGAPHPKALDFLGDYLALATGDIRLAHADSSQAFRAMHAGLRAAEMEVPLILVGKE